MREIEFKFWDVKNKERVSTVLSPANTDISSLFKHLLKTAEIIPLQYTGLKDKNGTKIFEGDFVEFENKRYICVFYDCIDGYNSSYGNYSQPVSGFTFIEIEDYPKPFPGSYLEWYMLLECKIIGNQYQNPELLNVPRETEKKPEEWKYPCVVMHKEYRSIHLATSSKSQCRFFSDCGNSLDKFDYVVIADDLRNLD